MTNFNNNIFKKYFYSFDIILILGLIFGFTISFIIYILNLNNIYLEVFIILLIYLFFNIILIKNVLKNKYKLAFELGYKNILYYLISILIIYLLSLGSFLLFLIPFFFFISIFFLFPLAYVDLKSEKKDISISIVINYLIDITKGYKLKLTLSILLQFSLILGLVIIGFYNYVFNLEGLNIYIKDGLFYSYIFILLSVFTIYQIDSYTQLSTLQYKKHNTKNKTLYIIFIIIGIIIPIILYFIYTYNNKIILDKQLDNSKRIMGLNAIQILIEDYNTTNGSYPDNKIFQQQIINKSDKNFKIIGNKLNNKFCPNGFEYYYNINSNNKITDYKLLTCLYEKNKYSINDGGYNDFMYELSNNMKKNSDYKYNIKIYDL